MYSRRTTSTPPENMTNSNRTTSFKPVILFNDDSSSSKDNTSSNQIALSDQEKIEKHRIKVKQMLDNNAKLWENTWSYDRYNSESISSAHNNNTSGFSQKEDRQKTNILQNLMLPYSFDSSVYESNDSSIAEMTNDTLSPQTENPISTYLTRDPQAIIPSTYKIEKGKEKSTDKSTSNALMIKLDLKDSHYLFQDESKEFTDFNPETLETRSYDPSNKKRKRENIPKKITDHLRQWLIQHKKHPYPTESEKQELVDETGLLVNQINNWFINARRRILQPMLKNESRKIRIIQDKVFYSNYPLFDQSLNFNNTTNESSNYRYTHRRFYRLGEEGNSIADESSSSASRTVSSTIIPTINVLEENNLEEYDN